MTAFPQVVQFRLHSRRLRASAWRAPAIAFWFVMLLAGGMSFGESAGMRQSPEVIPNPSTAAVALFVNSNLEAARAQAAIALRRNPSDADALFVTMEAAALDADTAGEIDAALRLCSVAEREGPDARAPRSPSRKRSPDRRQQARACCLRRLCLLRTSWSRRR